MTATDTLPPGLYRAHMCLLRWALEARAQKAAEVGQPASTPRPDGVNQDADAPRPHCNRGARVGNGGAA